MMHPAIAEKFRKAAEKMVALAYSRPNGRGRPRGATPERWIYILTTMMETAYEAGWKQGHEGVPVVEPSLAELTCHLGPAPASPEGEDRPLPRCACGIVRKDCPEHSLLARARRTAAARAGR